MPTFLAGLPLHPLVVHAVVVLVPLAVLAAVLVAVWPTARARFGWPAVVVAAAATASIPLATSTGEDLRDRLSPDPLIATHAELGDQLLILMAPMAVLLTGLVLLARRRRLAEATEATEATGTPATAPRWTRPAAVALTIAVVALAALSAVQVVRIGDSGARAVWHDTQYVAPAHRGDD